MIERQPSCGPSCRGTSETAQPVGSSHIASRPEIEVSSATVRNDMATLETEGYLHQPHTSAGRVPTDKGYRFFVDSLNAPARLEQSASQKVRSFFASTQGELEALLHDTSSLLANLTECAAVVVGPGTERLTVRSVQLVGLGSHLVLAVIVLSNGAVHKRTVDVAIEPSAEQLAHSAAVLSAALVDHAFDPHAAMAPSGDTAVDDLAARALGALGTDSPAESVYVGGTAQMVQAFDAIDKVREVLTVLEKQLVVVSLIRDILDRGMSVAIGDETGVEPLAECSLVVAPYGVDGEAVGTIGVLGPTRMNYPQAMAAVAVVSERLGTRLRES